MIRVQVTYPALEGERFDHAYFQSQHRALIEQLLKPHGLQAVQIDRGLPLNARNPAPHVAAAHMLFASLEGWAEGMKAHGKTLAADMANYTTITPQVQISQTQ